MGVSTNPNVVGKRHRQQMGQHANRIERASTDLYVWIDTIEQEHHDFYSTILGALQESTDPEDEALFNQLDREYSRQCASLQAARERITEAAAHLKNAVLARGHAGHLSNVSPDDFL